MKDTIHPGDGDPRHGTPNGYNNLACRCSECRKAFSAYSQGLRKLNRTLSPEDPRHGTLTAYQYWHCHCVDCRAASAISRRRQQRL